MSQENNNQASSSNTNQPNIRQSPQKRAGLHFPVSRVDRFLREGDYASRYSMKASVYLTAVLEYLASEIVDLAGSMALDENKVIITPQHILSGVQNDVALNRLMADLPGGTHIAGAGWVKPLPKPNNDENDV